MNEMIVRETQLPDNIKDLSKFVLVAKEKLVSVRAEIRAIDKLQLAKEVKEQKVEEARVLSEAVLDAQVKVGDLTKLLPKVTNNNPTGNNQHARGQSNTAVTLTTRRDESFKSSDLNPNDDDFKLHISDDTLEKSKKEIIEELGFTKQQVNRFETLADNKEVVEFVKTEARENGELPTTTRVLNFVAYQKKKEDEAYDKYMDGDKKYRELDKIIRQIDKLEFTQEDCDAIFHWNKNFGTVFTIDDTINDIGVAVKKLNGIYIKLYGMKGNDNVKKRF